MSIPEITKDQLALLTEVCGTWAGVFSQCDPIPSDPLLDAAVVAEGQRDVQYLIELGLFKDITEDHKAQLEEQAKKTGRTWRVFMITPLGKAMFGLQHSTAIH